MLMNSILHNICRLFLHDIISINISYIFKRLSKAFKGYIILVVYERQMIFTKS